MAQALPGRAGGPRLVAVQGLFGGVEFRVYKDQGLRV